MASPLISIGVILLLGLLATALGERTPLPRVTLLLLLGMAFGPPGLDLIPAALVDRFTVIASITMLMVGFLIGGKLSRHSLAHDAAAVVAISLAAALATVVVVTTGLVVLGLDPAVALLLGCVAAATDPAAVVDVVKEQGGGGRRGRFGDLLEGITALDDVWALLLFGICLAVATALQQEAHPLAPLLWAGRDVLGGALVGVAVGLPAALLTGRIRPGQPMLLEALGIVLLCGGLALALEVSYLIAAIVMGAVVANLARHHDVPFHAIEGIELPFMSLFFVLAGASLDLEALGHIGGLGFAYLLLRTGGKVIGGMAGARLSAADALTRRWVGVAMLPQAGVAIGMPLVAAEQLQQGRDVLLTLAIGSTVVFELLGAAMVRLAISRFASQEP